jgi:L-alanine-DL-glutamate epimerase-like enolase superfamily enzyme
MKIIGIEMFPVSMSFKRRIKTAFRGTERDEGVSEDNVILRIYTDEGLTGLGEAGTWGIYYCGESHETVMDVIAYYLFPKVLEGENPFNIDLIHKKMDEEVLGNTVAKSAIDFALYDIMGKTLNVPVYQLIGGCYAKRFPISAGVIGIGEPHIMAKYAKQSLEGLGPEPRQFKVKVGIDIMKNVKRVEAIRKAVGPKHSLLLDCNGSFNPKQAILFGRRVEQFAPLFLEQPVNYHDLEGLAEVKNNVAVPVGACECALTIEDMMRVIRMDAADFFNFKIDRLGGIYKGKQAVGMINAAGKWALQSAQISLGVGWAALAHFSASTYGMFRVARVCGGNLLREVYPASMDKYVKVKDVIIGGPKVKNGYAEPPSGPGLGIEINEQSVKEFQSPGKSSMLVGKKK